MQEKSMDDIGIFADKQPSQLHYQRDKHCFLRNLKTK